MPPKIQVQPLPYRHRKYFFRALFTIFALSMPVFLFYAIGYRYDFGFGDSKIVSTGGVYISAEADDVDMFIDKEFIDDVRLFRNASYIQSIDAGLHSLDVQGEGLQTWTKDLPVYPHIVTEAQAFNMPMVPQVRVIAPYVFDTAQVVFVATSSEVVLTFASSTNDIFMATSTATSSYAVNPEHEFIKTLFATTTATSSTIVSRVVGEVEEVFNFDSSLPTSTVSTATTTKVSRDVVLHEVGDEIYARWNGDQDSVPYYYCIDHVSATSTAALYGEHVYDAIESILRSPSSENIMMQNDRMNVCRDSIRIDRKWQEVRDFDFFPNSIDLVLLVLEDGLYVVEIDDRAWQNTQLLYPGGNLAMALDGGQIYLHDGEHYFEILTQITQ